MPTENRSSNTEEMVTLPRELSDDLAELIASKSRVCGGGAFDIWEAICTHAQPAAQHHGDTTSDGAEPAPTTDGASPEQMAAQSADGYRNGIKAAAELAADYPELAQRIRDLPLPK